MASSAPSKIPAVCECGETAWAATSKGYVTYVDASDADLLSVGHYAHIKGIKVYAKSAQGYLHRRVMNADAISQVDHVSGDGLDNRRTNLRLASHQENLRNLRKRKGCTSRFKGVNFEKGAWRATLKAGEIRLRLGTFSSEIEAAKIYDEAARKYHGEFACTNEKLGLL